MAANRLLRTSATRRRNRLPIGELEALSQGEVDGFCGLYAGINALRLLLHPVRPLSWRETRQLFAVGIRDLAKRGILADAATSGFNPRVYNDCSRSWQQRPRP